MRGFCEAWRLSCRGEVWMVDVAFVVEEMRIADDGEMNGGGAVVVVSVGCYGDEEDDDVMMKVEARR